MSELSREQVEALAEAIHVDLCGCGGAESSHGDSYHLFDTQRTVAAMLDQARAEGAAAVVRDVEAIHRDDGEGWCHEDGFTWPCATAKALTPHVPSEATERPPEPAQGGGKVTTPETGVQCGTQALSGRMVCQLRRGHDGAHEDWRQV